MCAIAWFGSSTSWGRRSIMYGHLTEIEWRSKVVGPETYGWEIVKSAWHDGCVNPDKDSGSETVRWGKDIEMKRLGCGWKRGRRTVKWARWSFKWGRGSVDVQSSKWWSGYCELRPVMLPCPPHTEWLQGQSQTIPMRRLTTHSSRSLTAIHHSIYFLEFMPLREGGTEMPHAAGWTKEKKRRRKVQLVSTFEQ